MIRALLLAGALALLSGSAALGSSSPTVKCSLPGTLGEHLGPSYVTALRVSGVSCSKGRRVVTDYYHCRVRAGGAKGRCNKIVAGFHCSESRTGNAFQFDAHVTCTAGRSRVVHDYVQNT